MPPLLPGLDRATRLFWRMRGQPVDLEGEHQWLSAPMNEGSEVADGWLQHAADAVGGRVAADTPGAGLLRDMAQLDGPMFRAADLHPDIRHFYEHTSQWHMEVRTRWSPVFRPGGSLITGLWGRRVRQLALPTRSRDVIGGMDSRVEPILDADGEHVAAAWLRTLRSTGEYVYSGCYSTRMLPGARRASVHVAFPLEHGNVQVFLTPTVLPTGNLRLSSPVGPFGGPGAYVVVDEGGTHAARVPIHETFEVFVDEEGVLRTDHHLRLWSASVVRLHYVLSPQRNNHPRAHP